MLPNRDEVDEEQILAALLGVAEMAGDLTDPEELLAAIVRITPGLVGVDRCAVLGYDKQAREFRTLAAFGPGGTPTGSCRCGFRPCSRSRRRRRCSRRSSRSGSASAPPSSCRSPAAAGSSAASGSTTPGRRTC